ncbi:hypothetical protein ciss_16100 [Carboxydothermus islandicus]|uniref:Uncharacterized protein n=1 Tax=Carboxydothermus islandicus TaxID=661089 RepID=A0A1L8D3J5_9THEO|nr:NAD(P)/FAD-dependent oxidoreductase [Carboxydothermus islandicus]GAV25677.1 hypothetical protein ciss_16100 [Carboxydothermus islandicus]
MLFKISNLRLRIEDDEAKLKTELCRKYGLREDKVISLKIIKKAVDARRKERLFFVYTILVDLAISREKAKKLLQDQYVSIPEPEVEDFHKLNVALKQPVVVAGAGPAGLFAALSLAKAGFPVLLLERGKPVAERVEDVREFWQNGRLNPESNVQFGEGGAGTFSDGKLTTRTHDRRIALVYKWLLAAGAPEEIFYLAKPHIGTDRLRKVVVNLRKEIIKLGGIVRFSAKVTGLLVDKGKVVGVVVNGREECRASAVVLAIGHSARDSFAMLLNTGVILEPKPFAIGLRIEHPQTLIDKAQYGRYAGHPKLGAAEYQLVYKNNDLGRATFSFCMCPGGVVVGASSEEGGVVTNGMSYYRRNGKFANSALVVSVNPEDFYEGPLGGVKFQREIEQKAYKIGGKNYHAPAQRAVDFLTGKVSSLEEVASATYKPGVKASDLNDLFPEYINQMLKEGLRDFNRKIPGFIEKGILTAPETRTSSPVRITRDEKGMALGFLGLFPAGEGAGYAGGIVSAAVDGIRAAEAVINYLTKEEG